MVGFDVGTVCPPIQYSAHYSAAQGGPECTRADHYAGPRNVGRVVGA